MWKWPFARKDKPQPLQPDTIDLNAILLDLLKAHGVEGRRGQHDGYDVVLAGNQSVPILLFAPDEWTTGSALVMHANVFEGGDVLIESFAGIGPNRIEAIRSGFFSCAPQHLLA